jgi:hypothetical protein
VTGLAGHLFALRPSDTRLNRSAALFAIPERAGVYRALVQIDAPGAWDVRIDTTQVSQRFVHAARLDVGAEGMLR